MYSVETGEWEQWEDLSQNLWGHSCTRVDNLVVVAGGVNPAFAMVATTFILDLDTRQQRVVGDLQADMQAVFNHDEKVYSSVYSLQNGTHYIMWVDITCFNAGLNGIYLKL